MAGRKHPSEHKATKSHYRYTVDEAMHSLDVAKFRGRRWRKDGSPTITDRKLSLILGSDLIDHLKSQPRPKNRYGPGESCCVRCNGPRFTDGAMIDNSSSEPSSDNLRALCPTCGTMMCGLTPHRQLVVFRAIAASLTTEASPHNDGRSAPDLSEPTPSKSLRSAGLASPQRRAESRIRNAALWIEPSSLPHQHPIEG